MLYPLSYGGGQIACCWRFWMLVFAPRISEALVVPRVIVSCSGLGFGPDRRSDDGEVIEEDC